MLLKQERKKAYCPSIYIYESQILTFNPSIHLPRVPPSWPNSSTGAALHRYRRGQGSNHEFFRSFSLLFKFPTNLEQLSRQPGASIRGSIYHHHIHLYGTFFLIKRGHFLGQHGVT